MQFHSHPLEKVYRAGKDRVSAKAIVAHEPYMLCLPPDWLVAMLLKSTPWQTNLVLQSCCKLSSILGHAYAQQKSPGA